MSPRKPWYIEHQGLVLDGHVASLGEGRAAAREWLLTNGATPFEAEQVTEQASVAHAWWAEQLLAFVGEHHEAAEPVTVIHVPAPK